MIDIDLAEDRKAVVVICKAFDLLDFAIVVETLLASGDLGRRWTPVLASPRGGPVGGGGDVAAPTRALGHVALGADDLAVVVGGGPDEKDAATLDAWLRAVPPGRRLCGVGAGVGDLVRALGDGDGALAAAATLLARERRVAVQASRGWLGAGRTATLDLMLTVLAEVHGRPHALRVAEALLLHVWRRPEERAPGATLAWQKRGGARFAALHDHIRTHLADDLGVERLADWCGMSPRTFARLYRRETGETPAAAVVAMRLEAARPLVAEPGLTLSEIAFSVGFGSELSFRRAFIQAFGAPPRERR